jgi:hypothetical protein
MIRPRWWSIKLVAGLSGRLLALISVAHINEVVGSNHFGVRVS